MFDDVQRGWLDGDDYRVAAGAAGAAGVVELPGPGDEYSPDGPSGTARVVLDELLTGRWEDSDPPGIGR